MYNNNRNNNYYYQQQTTPHDWSQPIQLDYRGAPAREQPIQIQQQLFQQADKPNPRIVDILNMPFRPPNTAYRWGIHAAASLGEVDFVESCVFQDWYSLNATNKHGWTPLMYSAQNGDFNTCRLLLLYGANPDWKNQRGLTSIELARIWGHQQTAELLDQYSYRRLRGNYAR